MVDVDGPGRDLRGLVLPEVGGLVETGEAWEPYRLLGASGAVVRAAEVYFAQLQAPGNPASTLRSYGMDLLWWWRFQWALGIAWDRATQAEGRDFARWMQLADKPVRVHWRHRQAGREPERLPTPRPAPGTPNPVTGKPTPGRKYAASTRAHSETVLRGFYDFHLDRGTDTVLVNPFPLDRSRRGSRAHEHHNPMDAFAPTRTGRYRPKVPKRIPKRIPDDKFNEIFAGLRSNRDRAHRVRSPMRGQPPPPGRRMSWTAWPGRRCDPSPRAPSPHGSVEPAACWSSGSRSSRATAGSPAGGPAPAPRSRRPGATR
ncbi:hypothetical protein AB0D71_41510 [Streptomyces avermitilis]|uniref:hypothetical protein n=1 Tax=Streptomyces avermitilis TaxID=33903 RepID=UPI0033ED9D42